MKTVATVPVWCVLALCMGFLTLLACVLIIPAAVFLLLVEGIYMLLGKLDKRMYILESSQEIPMNASLVFMGLRRLFNVRV